MTLQEIREKYAELLVEVAKALNEDEARNNQPGANPYARFLLPTAITNHETSEPLYNEEKVREIVEAAMNDLDDTDFLSIMRTVINFGMSLLPGT